MSTLPQQKLIISFFLALRQHGFALGIGELRAALVVAVDGWNVNDPATLYRMLRLLWCSNRDLEPSFREHWEAVHAALPSDTPMLKGNDFLPEPMLNNQALQQPMRPVHPPSSIAAVVSPSPVVETAPMLFPFIAPPMPDQMSVSADWELYWPISQRSMLYAWRQLRQPIADGPEDVLDLEATIDQMARQGFYLAPVYRRRQRNYTHLIMFIDQDGSMMPFHSFTRDIVQTALSTGTIEPGRVEVYYFNNVPGEWVYTDSYRTEPVLFAEVLAHCTSATSVVIVSDGGAARGRRQMERVRATTQFLAQVKQRTCLIAWLNPLPSERWSGTSAQIIAYLVPSFPIDADGLYAAVDVLRGKPVPQWAGL